MYPSHTSSRQERGLYVPITHLLKAVRKISGRVIFLFVVMIFKARLRGLFGVVPSWMWEHTWTFSFLEEDVFQIVSLQLGITYWFHQLTSDLSDLESADVLDVMNLNQKFCVLLRVNAFIWKQPDLITVVYNMERGQHMNSGQFVASGLKSWGICIVVLYKAL